jgi:hypothetical protein
VPRSKAHPKQSDSRAHIRCKILKHDIRSAPLPPAR